MNEVFLCEIQDVEFPLGFEMKADVFGLSVSYEVTDEEMAELNKSIMNATGGLGLTRGSISADPRNSMLPGSIYSQDRDAFASNQMDQLQAPKDDLKKLKRLNFPNCRINKPST